jgi:hypothetical protein
MEQLRLIQVSDLWGIDALEKTDINYDAGISQPEPLQAHY